LEKGRAAPVDKDRQRAAAQATQAALAIASGSLVGFSLGVVGGGGSMLAVPLLVYVVGLDNPHVAIGTSAIALITVGNYAWSV
jgi:uncharacterized membrane protein YfcA